MITVMYLDHFKWKRTINMKIALLVMMFPPINLGGTEIASYNIAERLAQRKNEVHVITSSDPGIPDYKSESGFFIHRTILNRTRYIGIVIFGIKSLMQIVIIHPELIHAQNITMGLIAFFGKKVFNIPYIVWGRGSDVHLQWRFKKIVSKVVLNNADAIIALSQNMKDDMQKISKKEVYILPNGVDTTSFNESKNKSNDNTTEIVYIGSLLPVKGVEYLIEAINILHQTHPKISLTIVGDGSNRRSLEQIVKKHGLEQNIIFTGKISHEDVPNRLNSNDIFVLPSISEGMPNVLLEAMAAGLPIVATNVGGIPDIVKNNKNGYLVEPKNPQQLAERIHFLIENTEIHRIISEQNQVDAQKYDWNNIITKLENIYSNVAHMDDITSCTHIEI